ncbi:hypothetical protein HN018_19585 [Lichenicola cladoniae]|uniref:Uncharacterized protein n=1 Tax=Lichenicola cladoniae TaxID=1484109 RepID=A0A6M8HUU0_9PROT|nr:hypothetical protein [Lichenicola cladoniae]NPD66064.1 hypothetical protein [Acetobacteraceae bacterium]QKE91941.1 hypothetical protein HN018_19585 [Lichenicola cladoniae]
MSALLQAERVVLGALLQPGISACHVIDDLPAEAFADPDHRDAFWRLLVGTTGNDDPKLIATLSGIGVTPEADVDAACRMIRGCWAERCRLEDEDKNRQPCTSNLIRPAIWSAGGLA